MCADACRQDDPCWQSRARGRRGKGQACCANEEYLARARARLPCDILAAVWEYIPYTVARVTCRTTNEMRLAMRAAPTGSAHVVHLAIQRFHWRWSPAVPILCRRSVVLEEEPRHWLASTREDAFVSYTLRFHDKWTGPPVPYDAYYCRRGVCHPPGDFCGPM